MPLPRAILLPVAAALLALLGGGGRLADAAQAAGLQLNVVSNLKLSYADHGSGASMDLFANTPSCGPTTVAPRCAEAWFSLGDVAGASATDPTSAIVARPGSDPTALAPPSAMELNWNTSLKGASHGTSGGVYTPTCPTGYKAMGSVAIEHDILHSSITPALFPTLRCLKAKYTKAGGPLSLLWDSKPTVFDTPCSVWRQPPQTIQQRPSDAVVNLPMLGGQRSFSAPPASVSLQFDTTAGIDVIVPPPPPCGAPPLPACPPCGDAGSGLPPCVCAATKPGPPPPCPAPPPSPACKPPHCEASRFLGADTTTQGAWETKYGKEGSHLFGVGGWNASASWPSYVQAITVGAPSDSQPSGSAPTPCPSSAPGFTNCSSSTFKGMCEAADNPGCCKWCDGAGKCVANNTACAGASTPPRVGRWPAMATAMDPRALAFPSSGVYRSLGFAATDSPQSGNASFEVSIELASSASTTSYTLSICALRPTALPSNSSC